MSCYYILLYAYAFPELKNIGIIQLDSLQNTYNLKVLALNLNFWIREKTLEQEGIFLDNLYSEFIFLLDPQTEIDNIQARMLASQRYFFNKKFQKYLSTTSYKLFFISENNNIDGVYGLCNQILLNSYEISINETRNSLIEFKSGLDNYQNLISVAIDDIINDIELVYTQTKNITLSVSIIYIIFSFVFFIVIFNSLISTHYKKISNIQKLEELIPIN